jgi:bacterioferritin (cytochrome b1)
VLTGVQPVEVKQTPRHGARNPLKRCSMLTRLIERIIFLDGFPNMQTLESLHIGKTVKAVLDSDLKAELSAHSLYAEAATHCHSVKDYGTRSLFETLMHDEGRAHRLSGNPDRSRPKIGPELYPNIISENLAKTEVLRSIRASSQARLSQLSMVIRHFHAPQRALPRGRRFPSCV